MSGHPPDVKLPVASALLALSALACGARSEIAGGGLFDDASMPIVDASPPSDVSAPSDVTAPDAGTCTAPQVQVGGNGAGTACKANVTWTCGDTKYRLGGGCDLPDAAWPDGDLVGAEGECDVNGSQTSMFTTPTCSCDPSAWIALAKQECPGSHQ